MARTLFDKVWEAHTVRTLPSGQTQLLIGLHLIHEVTTLQAFQMLKALKLSVADIRGRGGRRRPMAPGAVVNPGLRTLLVPTRKPEEPPSFFL
jgi:hypothetical protein